MRRALAHAVPLLTVAFLVRPAAGITLVQDGAPRAKIVISQAALAAPVPGITRGVNPPAAEKIKLAAVDLQTYLRQISGAEVPIVGDDQPVNGPVILVGASAATAKVRGLTIPSGLTNERNEEGFVIRARGDTLVLAGNDDGPYFCTYYAVAEFLNRLGVRWIMPGTFGEVVPAQKTIAFADVTVEDKPGFRLRTWWCNQTAAMGQEEARWKLRNKMQITETEIVGIPGDSWLRQYLPAPDLAKTRPELFGQRPDGSPDPYMANLTNPETVEIVASNVIAKVRDAAAKGQKLHALGFAPDDGVPMDHTPETMKLNQGFTDWTGREGVESGLSISEEWFRFMNKVAARVARDCPDLIITSNGYANRAIPPEGVALDPNLGVMYAYIWADTLKPMNHLKSWQGQVVAREMERWCQLCQRVFLYEYHLTMLVTMLTPVPQVQKMAVNYPLMKKWGVIGFFNEARQPWFEEGILTRYLRAQFFWNPNLEVPRALTDYYQTWYGPAAAPAAAFWAGIEDALLDSPFLGHEDRILPYMYTPDLMKSLAQSVAEAERLATTEPYRTRVKVDRLTLDHLQAYLAMHDAEFGARWADAAAQCDKMIAARMALHAISPFLAMPPAEKAPERYYSGDGYYGALQRKQHFLRLADLTNGQTGDLVALAPRQAAFKMDEAGLGKSLRWYLPGFDRRDWRQLDTTIPYYAQGYLSDDGVPTIGRMWYVFEVDVPRKFAGRPINVYSPVVNCQAWVWVNGEYVGMREYLDAYYRPAPIDLDVTKQIKPGRKNTVAVWVSTGINRAQAADGFQGRLFLYAPKPSPAGDAKQQ